MAIRASSYTNRKKEQKIQCSLSAEEASAFVAGDKDVVKELREAVKKALKG